MVSVAVGLFAFQVEFSRFAYGAKYKISKYGSHIYPAGLIYDYFMATCTDKHRCFMETLHEQ